MAEHSRGEHWESLLLPEDNRNNYSKASEYNKGRIRLLHAKLARYRLGYKCRCKWNRRRGNHAFYPVNDPLAMRLYYKSAKVYRILCKILGTKHV